MRNVLPLAVSLAISLVLTPLVRAAAVKVGMIARPKGDRWHARPTAMMGGVAIALSVVTTWLIFSDRLPGRDAWVVLGASVFLGLVGLVDDLVHVKPYQKLIGQLLGAAAVIYSGLVLPWTSAATINIAITFFWLIGITNAINLLDNMDGLAAGVAAIASTFLAVNLALNGMSEAALMCAIVAAALLGFLFYNSSPASIFMGDVGSMFVGFFLASAALVSSTGVRSRSFVVVIVVPLLVLLIPIFDTTLVTVARKLAGRPASQGGRDHASHRLVALGLSDRRAVWLLYGLATVSGMLAVLVNGLRDTAASIVLAIFFAIALSFLGVYLAGVRVYSEQEMATARAKPFIAMIFGLSYRRRLFEVSLDLVLVLLAFYVAKRLTLSPTDALVEWTEFTRESAALVVIQMVSLLAMGAYRGLWRYVSIDNLMVYTRAVALGSVVSYGVLHLLLPSPRPLASVFIVYGMALLLLIVFSRIALRLLRWVFPMGLVTPGQRALIYGAGDAGELLMRELVNNRSLGLHPVGFVDDDPLKVGKKIHGLRVAAGNGTVAKACQEARAEVMVISTMKVPDDRLVEIQIACSEAGVAVRRLRLTVEPVTDEMPARSNHSRAASAVNGSEHVSAPRASRHVSKRDQLTR